MFSRVEAEECRRDRKGRPNTFECLSDTPERLLGKIVKDAIISLQFSFPCLFLVRTRDKPRLTVARTDPGVRRLYHRGLTPPISCRPHPLTLRAVPLPDLCRAALVSPSGCPVLATDKHRFINMFALGGTGYQGAHDSVSLLCCRHVTIVIQADLSGPTCQAMARMFLLYFSGDS